MIEVRDIHWLAGLLEGEGCFQANRNVASPMISLSMADSDVVQKVSVLWRSKISSHVPKPNPLRYPLAGPQPTYKRVYTTRVYGSRAAGWGMTLYCLMGERRKKGIHDILAMWRRSKRRPNKEKE